MGIEYFHIKESTQPAVVPEVLGLDVYSCMFLGVSGSAVERLVVQGLKCGLNANICAHFSEKCSCDVPDKSCAEWKPWPLLES